MASAPIPTHVQAPTCPICDAPTPTDGPETRHAPFCSNRCKLIDLSRWLGEEYRVPGSMLGDGVASHADEEDYS